MQLLKIASAINAPCELAVDLFGQSLLNRLSCKVQWYTQCVGHLSNFGGPIVGKFCVGRK